nr:hypothetical protein [Tanacetum cinerariifolium]
MQEVILFNGLKVLTRQILDSKGVIPTKTVSDAKTAIQEMAEYSQKWHNETFKTKSTKNFNGLASIQAQLNNLRREIKKVNEKVYVAQGSCGLQYLDAYSKRATLLDDSFSQKEKDLGSFTLSCYINNICFEISLADLGASSWKIWILILTGMGDVIVGEPFCKASCIEARRFDGIITIHDADVSVTYQMVQSNLSSVYTAYSLYDTAYLEEMTRIQILSTDFNTAYPGLGI